MQGCDIMIAKDFIQKEHFMGERMDGCLSWEKISASNGIIRLNQGFPKCFRQPKLFNLNYSPYVSLEVFGKLILRQTLVINDKTCYLKQVTFHNHHKPPGWESLTLIISSQISHIAVKVHFQTQQTVMDRKQLRESGSPRWPPP